LHGRGDRTKAVTQVKEANATAELLGTPRSLGHAKNMLAMWLGRSA
jgi:hypothetical protein